MSFGQFGRLPTLVAFQKINLQGGNKLIVFKYERQEFTEVPHTIGCKIPQGIVSQSDYNWMEPFAIGEQ